MPSLNQYPRARTNDLIVSTVGSDLLLFDATSQHLHHLQRDAAAVWQAADGSRSVTDLADLTCLSEVDIHQILGRLAEAGLLETARDRQTPRSRVDRRRVLGRAGLAAAVISISAPLAAQAQSATCVPFNECGEPTWGQTCCDTSLICANDLRDRAYACFAPVFCDDPDFWQVQCWPA